MQKKEIGKSGIMVTPITLGTWAMGGDFWGVTDDQLCVDALRAGLDAGINIIDTAPVYGAGHAEELVGKAIKGINREDVVIATKFGVGGLGPKGAERGNDASKEAMLFELDRSLKLMGTDYIDLYQVHWPDPDTPIEETMEALNEVKKAGKIRAIGVSNFDIPLLEAAMKVSQIDSVQPQYSLLAREIEKEYLPYCIKNDIGVLSYGSLGAGMLTGKYKEPPKEDKTEHRTMFYPFYQEPLFSKALKLIERLETIAEKNGKTVGQVALNWVISQPGMTTALVGCKNPEQAIQNAQAASWTLDQGDLDAIRSALVEIYGE
jgi:aryl-alcohol dehydrogenase-like predicted oxidoreductase